nr:ribonuclease H-like domain-containing protein [Tanacetum cinerariifolium]
ASTTAEQRLAKKNELKARVTLLMALPYKNQLKFNIHKNAKSLIEAIEKSTTESVSVVPSVFATSSKALVSTLLNVDSLSDAVIYSFFANLKWQMAMLTMRARRNKDTSRRTVPMEVSTSNALVSQLNDRYKSSEGYHVVLSPYTGTFMPPKPDLIFNDAPNASESVDNVVNVESSSHKPSKDMPKILRESVKKVKHPKQAENLRTDNQKSRGHKNSWNRKACFVCKSLNHLIKDCDFYEKQMVQKPMWNHAMRVNHHNSVRMTHPHSNRNFVPIAVLTRSRLVSLNAARPVSTAVPQSTVKSPRPGKHVVNKAHSPINRPIKNTPATKHSNFNKQVTTVKVNKVNDVQGTKGNAKKSSANWVWKPKCTVLNHVSRLTSASMTLKQFDYTDALGRSNKAFRVFNSRTKIVQETLHINFLENKPNVARSEPQWLFDIDTLTKFMNYQPVNTDDDVADVVFDVKKNENEVYVSPSRSDKAKKHNDKAKRADKGKSRVDLSPGVRDLRAKFKEFSSNNTNRVNAVSTPVTAGQIQLTALTVFILLVLLILVLVQTLKLLKNLSFMDLSNYPDDLDMPALEDII